MSSSLWLRDLQATNVIAQYSSTLTHSATRPQSTQTFFPKLNLVYESPILCRTATQESNIQIGRIMRPVAILLLSPY